MEEIISLSDARDSGMSHYFTGKPCPQGHVAKRRVINQSCVACNAENAKRRHRANPLVAQKARDRAKAWAAKHPDRYKANQAQYRAEHEVELKAYNDAYREANREKLRHRDKKRRPPEVNAALHKKRSGDPAFKERAKQRAKKRKLLKPDEVRQNAKNWRQNNPGKVRAISANRRSLMRMAGKMSPADVLVVMARTNCEACGCIHPHMEIDHIVALVRGGTNHLSNLQLLCRPCNRSKGTKDHASWAAERAAVTEPQR